MSKDSLWFTRKFKEPINDAQLFTVDDKLIVFGGHNVANVYRFDIPHGKDIDKQKIDFQVFTKFNFEYL